MIKEESFDLILKESQIWNLFQTLDALSVRFLIFLKTLQDSLSSPL
jgi:hypothetical protein